MLLELLGTPPVIRTQYETRWNSTFKEVKCPRCHMWSRLEHNSYCYTCDLWLVEPMQPAPAVVTEPAATPVAEPQTVASIETSAPAVDEQDALIAELAFEADAVVDREHYVAKRTQSLTSKKRYVLWHRRSDMMATDCSCGDRRFRGRFQGRCCKHMAAHNDMLKPATQQQEAA